MRILTILILVFTLFSSCIFTKPIPTPEPVPGAYIPVLPVTGGGTGTITWTSGGYLRASSPTKLGFSTNVASSFTTLSVASGGTNHSSWATGGLLYADTTTSLSQLNTLPQASITSLVSDLAAKQATGYYYSRTLNWGDLFGSSTGSYMGMIRMASAGAVGSIINVYAVYASAPTTISYFDIQKTTQAEIDSASNWVSILSTLISVDANEYSSNTAATPAVISTSFWAVGDHFRVNVATAGANGSDLTIEMNIRQQLVP